ncbi:MAG: SRPBCC family protein [Gaiellaceae bacterium]
MITLERTYPAPPPEIWRMWTTKDGIEAWWPPEGFTAEVHELDLRPGGLLRYTFTATGEEQIAFMQSVGMPLATTAEKRFTTVEPHRRLAYDSLVDFVPGMDAYWQATTVEIEPDGDGSHVVMTMDALHDEEWTQRLIAGRASELDNLAQLF